MAKFFFSLSRGKATLVDRKGVELASAVAARQRALCAGSAIVENLSPVIRVSDEAGNTVYSTRLDVSGVKISTEASEKRDPGTSGNDELTGLADRAAFRRALTAALGEARRDGTKVALILLDLDFLKDTNDAFGHLAGDALLRTVAQRLKEGVRPTDTAARLGGDEFAVIMNGIPPGSNGVFIIDKLQQRLRDPVLLGDNMINASASAGVAVFPDHETSEAELLKSADIALYAAKAASRGSLVLYTPEMRAERERSLASIATARSALAEARIVPFYQPKVSLGSGAIVGFEALLRVRHPIEGIQPPSTIVDAFNHPDLSTALGAAMQVAVFADMQGWIRGGVPIGKIALNASPVELLRGQYAERFLERLADYGIPPGLVEVELTETAMMGRGSKTIISELHTLRAAGVGVSLDDFGTGYGSLTHLLDLPISGLKIDQTFIRDLDVHENARLIVEVIVGLARGLKLTMVAEGVERVDQERYLQSRGCDVVQGFLYSKPLPFSAVSAFLADRSPSVPGEAAIAVAVSA